MLINKSIQSKITLLYLSCFLIASVLIPGCATPSNKVIPVTEKLSDDNLKQEEADLLKETIEFQTFLQKQNAFYEEEALNAYINEIAAPFLEKINLKDKQAFTFKVVRDPTVNAYAMINGHIYFQAGILAKIENEAQLAYVLGHEISHVYHRDQLYQVQNLKRKTVTFKVADLILTPPAAFFGAGSISDAMMLTYATLVLAYSREDEARADRFGLEGMVKAGYDPNEAIRFEEIMLNEEKNYRRGLQIFFLSTHPTTKSRREAIKAWIAKNQDKIKENKASRLEKERYLEKTYIVRKENVNLNMDSSWFYHALDNLESSMKQNASDPVLHYYQGEIYRLMPNQRRKIELELSRKKWKEISSQDKEILNKKWLNDSLKAYQKAIQLDANYAPSYKGIGIYYFDQKDFEKAKLNFEKYLELNPLAKDKRSVIRYLEDIKESNSKGIVTS